MAKKTLTGTIISNKMQKTVVVRVEKIKEHPKYKRRYKYHKKYKAHLEEGDYKVGDKVVIQECRPISKEKKWRVIAKATTHNREETDREESALPNKEEASD